jgi:broad specificity phosphatase PhoE
VPTTTVHLVRHGQVANPDRVLYGRLPGFGLSPQGRAQGELLARHFESAPLAAVIASPLERTLQTAEPIAAAHGLPVGTDQRLLEAANLFEGVTGSVAWYILRHPRVWWRLRSPRGPSWGESNADIAARMRSVISDARDGHPGRQVVLVSHQAPIWIVRLSYEGRSLTNWPGRRQCALGSVTTLAFRDGQLAALTYSEPAAAPLVGTEPGRPGA